MRTLELFAGIGGLSLGLERAGFHVVGQVEIDPYCRTILERHWPEVPRHDDVRTAVDWWRSEPRPRVDVVAGGYPCQPESTAGRRRGTADDRWLWPEFARVVHAVRPRYVIGENVMGHRTSGLRFVLRDLERLGYATRAGVVSAEEMGAPHRRARIFVIAELADAERDGQLQQSGSVGQEWGRAGDGGRESGSGPHVANAERDAGQQRQARDTEQSAGGRDADRSGVGPHVADANGAGRRQGRAEGSGGVQTQPQSDQGSQPAGGGWWAAEPDVGRVAYGVPGRVDRLRVLGNAVVPQVAEFVGRLVITGAWREG